MSGSQGAAGSSRPEGQPSRGWLIPSMAAGLAAAIFIIDTLSPLDMAIAVLYVGVVLFSASFLERRSLLLVGGACICLTLLSFTIIHGQDYGLAAAMRSVVSITAITVTTLLSLRNQAATRSLREQADLLDLTHDAIFVRDDTDTITYWNHGAEKLYGWSGDEAVGRKAAELLQTVFPSPTSEINAEIHRTGRWEGELVHVTRGGDRLVIMSRWSLQRDERGRPLATMETNSDITARKRAEHALHQAQAELAHVTRITTMGGMTASIAHEVNQPLAAVVTNGEACLRWLGRTVPDIEEAQAAVEQMIRNGRRASDVVARLRSLARRSDPLHVATDINEVVDDVLLLLERELSNNRVSCDLSLGADLPPVLGDRVQLQQVTINLALNALQAMEAVPEGQRHLKIRTALADTDVDKAVIIEVRDSGPGVNPQSLPMLFDAFYSTKKDGMGMGLSISRSIIEAHAGRISAALNDEGGMCFKVLLPVIEKAGS